MDRYEFNRPFRIKILSLLTSPIWISNYGVDLIKPEYFETDDEIAVAKALLDYYEEFNRPPSDPEDVLVLCKYAHEELIYDIYDREHDTELATKLVVKFAREQAAKIAILDSVDDVKAGNIDRIIGRMEEVISIGESLRSPGIDFIRDMDKWLYSVADVPKIKTGWPHIDRVLDGGLSAGEYGLVMAPTNRGKSMALVNIGHAIAGIGSGKNVVHITHEMGREVVARRYAARTIFRFPTRRTDLDVYGDELTIAAKRMVPGNVRILDLGRCTVQDIRIMLDRLLAEDYRFDVIIDDYPDLIVSSRKYGERRFELSLIHAEMRALGGEYGVPVWAATHSNRASYTKEVIGLGSISEDIGKARIADVVVAICQTREEADADQCRLFLAKVRDGSAGAMFDAKFYKESQAIITTGITKRKDKDA